MKCDCCGNGYDIMYRTMDTRVYCLDCSRRRSICCYGKPIVPSKWFRVAMSERQLDSLEERGHKREFEPSCNPLTLTRDRTGTKQRKRTGTKPVKGAIFGKRKR